MSNEREHDEENPEYVKLKNYVEVQMMNAIVKDLNVAEDYNRAPTHVIAYEDENETWWCVAVFPNHTVDIFRFEIGSDDDQFYFENVSDESHYFEFPIPESL